MLVSSGMQAEGLEGLEGVGSGAGFGTQEREKQLGPAHRKRAGPLGGELGR